MTEKTQADALREAVREGPKVYYPLDNYGHVASAIPVSWLSQRAEQLEEAEFEPSDAEVDAAARMLLPDSLGPWEKAKPKWQNYARLHASSVLRAAARARRAVASDSEV